MKGSLKALALCMALAVVAGCNRQPKGGAPGGPGGPRGPVAFPVEVAPVESSNVEYLVSAVGSVEAFEQVQITARVAGVVERVDFTEGQEVKKGALLVEIEPARYALAVKSAQAALERAKASEAEARAASERRVAVVQESPGLLPAEQLEQAEARARTAGAEVQAAQAALERAQLDLRDAYVRAPMEGVLQTRTVQTGQFVQPGTVLATLLRRDPLLLRFSVPEADAGRLHAGMKTRFTVRADGRTYTALITHVADAADASSRMVRVTAQVEGEGARLLRPGAFATVSVPVASVEGAPVVPQTAVRPSERGFLAYVVEEGKARERVLELGLRTADGKVEVRKGLKPGESLVVRGAEALKEGATVRIAEGPKPSLTGEPRAQPVDNTGKPGGVAP